MHLKTAADYYKLSLINKTKPASHCLRSVLTYKPCNFSKCALLYDIQDVNSGNFVYCCSWNVVQILLPHALRAVCWHSESTCLYIYNTAVAESDHVDHMICHHICAVFFDEQMNAKHTSAKTRSMSPQ